MASKRIVWDIQKDRINRTKHRISFEEASGVFFDPMSITVDDADHSWYEQRFISIGKTKLQKLLIVFFTETDTEIRIISARKPTRAERLSYEEER